MSAADKLKGKRVEYRKGPLWTGPEGEGPQGGVTQSLIGRWLECRARFAVRMIEGWKGADQFNKYLEYGNMWHVCEEAHASGAEEKHLDHWSNCLKLYCQNLAKKYPTQLDEVDHWYRTCKAQFPHYTTYWAKHPDVEARTPLMQEQMFDVPYSLPSGRVVRLRGKFDSVDLIGGSSEHCTCGADRTGPSAEAHEKGCPAAKAKTVKGLAGIWLQENKTKSEVDRAELEQQLKFDLQSMFYLVALTEGRNSIDWPHDWDEPVLGVRYNVVRRPFSSGKGNIQRKMVNKTNKTEETKDDFFKRLSRDYFEAEPEYWFQRWKAEVSPTDVKRFRDECLDPILEAMCWWYDFQAKYISTDRIKHDYSPPNLHWRHPYGVRNMVGEGFRSDVENYLETGSTVGLVQNDDPFPELK